MPKRVDANQAAIVAALRKAGASVQSLASIGKGCPDLLVGVSGKRTWLLEVKSAKGVLTDAEVSWAQTWRGPIAVVRTAEQALETCGLLKRRAT